MTRQALLLGILLAASCNALEPVRLPQGAVRVLASEEVFPPCSPPDGLPLAVLPEQIAELDMTSPDALVLLESSDVYWAVCPALAGELSPLISASVREAFARRDALKAEADLTRALEDRDPDALEDAALAHPFSPLATRAARLRAELLLERGSLDEALLACENLLGLSSPAERDASRSLLEAMRALCGGREPSFDQVVRGRWARDDDNTMDDRFAIPAGLGQRIVRTSSVPDLVTQAAREGWTGIEVLDVDVWGYNEALVGIDRARFVPVWRRALAPNLWRISRISAPTHSAIVSRGLVFMANRVGVSALIARTGRLLWVHACTRAGHELTLSEDLSVAGDTLERRSENRCERLDLRTGAVRPW
jgi:hypothetical protein